MVATDASESLPRYQELRSGILLIDTLTRGQSADIVAELEGRSWRQSTIAQVRDFSVVEYPDIHIRSALAMGVLGDDQVGQDLFVGIRTDALRVFNKYWGLNVRTTKNPQFTRYEKGHFIKVHTDTGGAYPNRIGSVVTYLTDDYGGGEINFPKFGLKIRPAAGQTLVFPSDYVHEVLPIEDGAKVIFLFFIESD